MAGNNRPRSCWFDMKKQQAGGNEKFIEGMDSRSIIRDAPRIFKDIINHNINITVYAKYFIDPEFNCNRLMECLLSCASYKIHKYHILFNASMEYQTSYPVKVVQTYQAQGVLYDPNCMEMQDEVAFISSITEKNRNLLLAYQCIYDNLVNLANTKDPSYIMVMANKLQPYKNSLLSEGE